MGAGYHGGFGSTIGEGKKNSEMSKPIRKHGDVRYSAKKTQSYLLNPTHPVGGAKAKFMKDVLGYTVADSKLFHKNVVSAIIDKTPTTSIQTQYGMKHTYNTILFGKKGNKAKANVVVIIQKDKGRITHKIITVYPDKKEK